MKFRHLCFGRHAAFAGDETRAVAGAGRKGNRLSRQHRLPGSRDYGGGRSREAADLLATVQDESGGSRHDPDGAIRAIPIIETIPEKENHLTHL